MGFFDDHIERPTAKNRFFKQVDTLIDWIPVEKELKKMYKKGLRERDTKAYALIFVQDTVDTGMVQAERRAGSGDGQREPVGDLFFRHLLEDDVPDHSTLSHFRSELIAKKAYDWILKKVNG